MKSKFLIEMDYRLGKLSREEYANILAEEKEGEGDAGGESLETEKKPAEKKAKKKSKKSKEEKEEKLGDKGTAKKPEGKEPVTFKEDCQDDLFTLQRKADYGYLTPKERAKFNQLKKEVVNSSSLTKPNYYETNFSDGDEDYQ